MKKLLVTVIGAAAAIGAYAQLPNTYWFEDKARGATDVAALGSSWSEAENSTNTYAIVELERAGQTLDKPAPYNEYNDPTNALSVKTTFGKPLSFKADSDAVGINTGIYFDSLVKFTVCEEAPDQTYDGAKIVMWLQEQSVGDTVTGTNLMVRAGFLSVDNSGVNVVSTNYLCNEVGADFADKWHRVTIKAIADITESGAGVPAFAIYIDGAENKMVALCDDAKWDATFTYGLAEAVTDLGESMLFPSLVQDSEDATKLTLEKASFDGTGFLAELVFTETAPEFAKDFVSDKAGVTINDKTTMYPTLAEAVAAVNEEDSGNVAFTLAKGMTITEPLVFTSGANVVLDFAGFVLTNNAAYAAISNTCNLTIMNSKGVGGIRCTAAGTAVAQGENGSVAITGGNFWGDITNEGLNGDEVQISGGSFQQNAQALGDYLVAGKKLQYNAETGLYDVVNKVYVAQIAGGASYETFKEAVDAANAGDTVTVLADCTVTEAITFSAGINLVNNYTITINGANYALRIANGTTTPVTLSGTGSIVWASGSGSPILVGSNEKKASYGINDFYEGSFVLNGGTLTSTDKTAKGGNLVKLEAGTFVLNDGTINGGTRGVKADSEGNNATCVLTINGGTIVNTNSAAIAASTAGSGSSTVTVNGGTFTGKLDGTGMVTIPGTSTAKFDRDQTAFCAAGYETTLSAGWYVVTAIPTYTIKFISGEGSTTNEYTKTRGEAVEAPTAAAVVGKTFSAWSPAVVTPAAADATYTAQYEAINYTVLFISGEGSTTQTVSKTYGQTIASGDVNTAATVEGKTFTGWDPAPSFPITVTDNAIYTAQYVDAGPVVPVIDPGSDEAVVPAKDGETAEQAAARVEIGITSAVEDALTTAGVLDSTYQGYFSKTAVKDGDNWTVTAKFTEAVETAAATAAAAVVDGKATTVTVPAGLYYKVTTMTSIGGKTTIAIPSTLSTGTPSATISKPGDTQGFIKIELDTAPIE